MLVCSLFLVDLPSLTSPQSETFEYVRLDRKYRYVSEQVSHHPPISACWAESPLWRYYGEVDAQNKFMGKSFEIRPTGVAHADLILPPELGPGYPKATGPETQGKVVEHYSWKKVTTNISGFILGSPTIDHYGDMVVCDVPLLDRLEVRTDRHLFPDYQSPHG